MKTTDTETAAAVPHLAIHVCERGTRARRGALTCQIEREVEFSPASMESYFFAKWEPIAYDALLVAAAVEFADKTRRRPSFTWRREFDVLVPVHDPDRWNDRQVKDALIGTLSFLTGDVWKIDFYKRRKPADQPQQSKLNLPSNVEAVLPFSNGLDSKAVAGLMTRQLGDRLVRIRLGSKLRGKEVLATGREPFTSVPYQVKCGRRPFVESSARSRGFKFALVSGLAAYLSGANQIILPESGQGALGPALVPVGQAYEDYRGHPLFTTRMEAFIAAILGHGVEFAFPRLWATKAETLKAFIDECGGDGSWADTWSCWQQSRQVSVDHKKRQCGICAACMLRRFSIHAAGARESKEHYVWEDLSAATFETGAAATFPREKITRSQREYAIAGVLHFDHLAGVLGSPADAGRLKLSVAQLSGTMRLDEADTTAKLDRLLRQHKYEWTNFVDSLGRNSFVADWALSTR
ncbi:MAG TPA: 7-cyano-7-deazaguanine synthase [Terracidiphilus sp.]|nr:7-cyano-7-deazaguanine synthase [Terracidiphilus sp.]